MLKVADPQHGAILTGGDGPSHHSVPARTFRAGGITIPGFIYLAQKGQATFGYPEFSANLTSVYEFSSGLLKGFKIGGTQTCQLEETVGIIIGYNGFTGPTSPSQLPLSSDAEPLRPDRGLLTQILDASRGRRS